ncbi:hypothetical protein LWI29_000949 [Acer saccharum]|uniref:Receptor-like serine/threonine-protein kinase n=1 Tax=Acer saccharum TaxID=4024 RepID=A0AA39W5D8_ACESA|nr:hypothetical protein LWI29_000949 [Acer saccharum]
MASATFYLILLLCLLPYFAIAETAGRVPVGETLTAGNEASPWLSPSSDFAFGFQELKDNKDLFLLSIWYHKIPEKTIVWYGYGGAAAVAPRGSQVELTVDRGLILKDPQGQEIWNSDVGLGAVAYGVMNDTGNFVLVSGNSDELWDSFSYPTDTLLPFQVMETDGELFSRRSQSNFSRGRFQLRFSDGNLVLSTVNLPTKSVYDDYYNSRTSDGSNLTNSGYRVMFNESGYMYILRRNDQRFILTTVRPVSTADFYQRATLDYDGVFTQYLYPKASTGNRSWSTLWSQPENICVGIDGGLGSGACGFNNICSLNGRRPMCNCPKGYSLIDKNDVYGSCKPDFELSCNEETQNSIEDLYDFFEINDIDWPTSDYEFYKGYNEVECRNSCLHDCLCAVAISREGCWKKKLPLSNGRVDSTLNAKAFIKYRKGDVPPSVPRHPADAGREGNLMSVTASLLLGSSVFINFILVGAFGFGFFFIYKKKFVRVRQGESTMETNLRCFTYKELVEATDNFKEEVGRGSFGVVYKGLIQMSSIHTVAVKKLDRIFQDGEKEFKNEVMVIGQTHHKNLVRLIGFCEEGQHRLLVYEFLSNGTLANFLFSNAKPYWNQRSKIAFGIARGLLYLHEECSTQIVHCDIKPQNVLLDENCNAQISDFGLAKLLMMNQSQTKTNIRGTKGYVAPEWFRNKPVTAKVDVYSYGVLLLEIICCRKSIDVETGGENYDILTDWAFDCYRSGKLDVLVEGDMEALSAVREVERFLMVAIWCIQEDPSLRPTMRKVTQMLEGVVEVAVPPNPSPD